MDIRAKDVLKRALKNYDGTLIVVSHDRDFLNGLVDKVYEFTDGRVKEHLGGVDDFLRAKKVESFRELEMNAKAQSSPARSRNLRAVEGDRPDRTAAAPPGPRAAGAGSMGKAGQAANDRKEDKKRKNRQQQLEKQIEELEAKMAKIEQHLSAPTPDDDIMELTRNYLELKRELDEKMSAWAEM